MSTCQNSMFLIIKDTLKATFQNRSRKLEFVLAVTLLFLGIGSNVFTPIIFSTIIDKMNLADFEFLTIVLASYGLIWTLSQAMSHIREIVMNRFIERCNALFASQIFRHVYELPKSYLSKLKMGELTNIIRRAQANLPILLWALTLQIIPIVIELSAVMYILFQRYSMEHISILIVTLLTFLVFSFLMTAVSINKRSQSLEAEKVLDSKLLNWLSNLELIRAFAREEKAKNDYDAALSRREDLEVSYLNSSAHIHLGQAVILGLGLTAMTYLLGHSVKSGSLTVGDFVLFNAYFIQFTGPISSIGYVFNETKKSLLEIKDISNIFSYPIISKRSHNLQNILNEAFSITFDNVSFIQNENQILKNLSFKIPAGDISLIAGPSGYGKSTVLKLILGIYKPTRGNIYINDTDINHLDLKSLRDRISYVPQDNSLIDASLLDNIQLFDQSISPEDIENALDQACIRATLEKLPHGLQTMVGDRGPEFSGGEKQRICLARAFAKPSSILLFDEPTSAVDRQTEQTIYRNIKTHREGATIIIVSHAAAAIDIADHVIEISSLATDDNHEKSAMQPT